ncbi:hypothetical protein H0H92_005557 [Tricholoma furcatifolium]|nr:hypothetical protein H0H92_005557 [Tricholoma furcatifolium]
MSRRTEGGPIYDLQCWDLHTTGASTSPKCIAHRTLNRGWVVFNQRPGSLAEVAVQSPGIELLKIDFSAAENPASGFHTLLHLPSITDRLVAFHESFVITKNEQNHLSLSHMRGKDIVGFKLISYPPYEQVLDVLIQGRIAIVVRLKRLEMFAIDGLNANQKEIYPMAQHIFQWNIDSLAVSPQKQWPLLESDGPYPLVNILIRFGSLLPWPVNLIHHFVLLPDSAHDTNRPITSDNVPYSAVPVVRRTIGAPVRLFSNYHMAMGSHGTAVWIDTHMNTEHYYADGGRGQRLAGSRVGKVLTEDDEDWEEDSNEMEGPFQSSVFGYSENDEWARVAVDEEGGRIAISHLDGTVVINEYI